MAATEGAAPATVYTRKVLTLIMVVQHEENRVREAAGSTIFRSPHSDTRHASPSPPPPVQILLGMKKRGFGKGRFNGFGGKVEPGETVAQGAARELEEEAGIVCPDLARVGQLEFMFEGKPQLLEVHVYAGSQVTGAIAESEEMAPQWFAIPDIPYAHMWPDDKLWLPTLLHLTGTQQGQPDTPGPAVVAGEGPCFFGRAYFRGMDTILTSAFHRTDSLPPPPTVTAIPMPWTPEAAQQWLQDMAPGDAS